MRCTALLCLAILRPFKYECSHVDRPCVFVIAMAQCVIGDLMCEGPKNIFHVVPHVLHVSKL